MRGAIKGNVQTRDFAAPKNFPERCELDAHTRFTSLWNELLRWISPWQSSQLNNRFFEIHIHIHIDRISSYISDTFVLRTFFGSTPMPMFQKVFREAFIENLFFSSEWVEKKFTTRDVYAVLHPARCFILSFYRAVMNIVNVFSLLYVLFYRCNEYFKN